MKSLNNINQESIKAAGPRYSPVIDPGAPNLIIEPLVNAIEALALTDRYRNIIVSLGDSITSSWEKASKSTVDLFSAKNTPINLLDQLRKLQKQMAGESGETMIEISRLAKFFLTILDKKQNNLWEQEKNIEQHTEEWRLIQGEISSIRQLQNSLRKVMNFVNSPSADLVINNKMLILGDWGTGKTHFLCDITKERMVRNIPTLFFLAHRLPMDMDPLTAICASSKTEDTPEKLLRKLNKLGIISGGRALIIFDGINEADKTVWKKSIKKLAELVDHYPNVGLVLSCRTPFDKQIFTLRTNKYFVKTYHTGFQDIEFDAQRAFFKYYNIPNSHIPLLTPEFTRPLFLKILCLTFSGKTSSIKSRWIREIAAGQRGMTKLFEDFVLHIGKQIEDEFMLSDKICWKILKGQTSANGETNGIAVSMMEQVRDYLFVSEALSVVNKVLNIQKKSDAVKIFKKMISAGLLVEDTIWKNGKQISVIRLPYQRFSDHLIARHLIENYLKTSTEKTIRQSFYRNRPLGKIFEIDQWGHSYKMPGLASAVMLEFPERVKRTLPLAERELAFYLPKQRRMLSPLIDGFLEGLLWRSRDSFSQQTDILVSHLVNNDSVNVKRNTFEVLVSLACRPDHPYSAQRLYGYLKNKKLVDRDLLWSEYLRNSYNSSVVYRILDWVEGNGLKIMSENIARNIILLLSLFLTTTNRSLRDRTTKMLVLIGDKYPEALFDTTILELDFNDPYVPERMLAASYGVAMHSWAFPSMAIKESLPKFARQIYDGMFTLRAPHLTKHILSRDYALGILELAQKVKRDCLGIRSLKNLKSPFKSKSKTIPSSKVISEKYCKTADGALMMDFKNYTIGRLISNRQNYDFKNKEYKNVLKQVKWRILDLGYEPEKFKAIDNQISDRSFYREPEGEMHKVDRYGKKYSWIAFFEVAGMQADLKLLPERHTARIPDCDIDPSFPEQLKTWKPSLNKFFTGRFTSARSWVTKGGQPSYDNLLKAKEVDNLNGPWVLLGGYIRESAHNDSRRMFTFLNGVFVDAANISKLRNRFNAKEYPGNRQIPEPWQDYYTFAGEIPWSKKYGFDFYTPGKSKRHISDCYEIRKNFNIRKKVSDLTESEKFSMALNSISILSYGSAEETILETEKKKEDLPKYVDVPQYKIIPGIPLEIPIHRLSWEGYHSSENQGGGADYLSPAMCSFLKLRNKSNLQDLFDANNKQATIYRLFGEESNHDRSSMFYVRKDLLEKYLSYTNQKLVWLIWGERDFKYEVIDSFRSQIEDVWSVHGHVFKKVKVANLR